MQPINYMQGYQNPLEKILNQVKMYQDYSQNANVLASQREQNRLSTAHNDRRIEAMNALKGLDFSDEGKLREWAGRYGDLEYGKGVQDYLSTLSEQEKQTKLGQLSQVYSALMSGDNQVAYDFLQQQAQAYENAGSSDEAEDLRYMANLIQTNPQTALQSVALAYANIAPKEGMENYKTLIDSQKHDIKTLDMGDRVMGVIQDPWGNFEKYTIGDKGVSPDTVANNDMRWNIAEMEEQGRNSRSDADREADFIKHQNQMIYEAQKERMKSGQVMTNTEGYQMIYYPDGRAEYVVDPDGNRVRGNVASNLSDGDKKAIREAQDQILATQNSLGRINKVIDDLNNGVLDLGLGSNALSIARNKLGYSNEGSRAYADMQTVINDAVNQILMLAKGTQTEGDANRAAKIITATPLRDKQTALEVLGRLQKLAQNTIQLKQAQMAEAHGGNHYVPKDPVQNAKETAGKYITGL